MLKAILPTFCSVTKLRFYIDDGLEQTAAIGSRYDRGRSPEGGFELWIEPNLPRKEREEIHAVFSRSGEHVPRH